MGVKGGIAGVDAVQIHCGTALGGGEPAVEAVPLPDGRGQAGQLTIFSRDAAGW